MGKTGLQREMDSFFRETENEQFSIRRITKGGFGQSHACSLLFTVDALSITIFQPEVYHFSFKFIFDGSLL
jgi:hypothetical protein